jgi:hypothetical protein
LELQQLMHVRWILVGAAATACGNNDNSHCDPTDTTGKDSECVSASLFAARDTAELVPHQDEIDRYYDRWRRVVEAEPFLLGFGPQTYRLQGPGFLNPLSTTNPTIIAIWGSATAMIRDPQPAPLTGDPNFDSLLSEFHEPVLLGGIENTEGVYEFVVASGIVVNEEVLQQRLLAVDAFLPEPFQRVDSDGQWQWSDNDGTGTDDSTAQIDYRRGFGDCTVSCAGFRDLRAVVGPTGPAMVFDLGGDPLPPNLHLSPNTVPLP